MAATQAIADKAGCRLFDEEKQRIDIERLSISTFVTESLAGEQRFEAGPQLGVRGG